MANFDPKNIRNVAVLGHQGCGKTTLVESLLYIGGTIAEKGSIEKKNTVSDYLDSEQKRQQSLQVAIAPLTHDGIKVNLFDLPGNDDFVSDTVGTLKVVRGAILVIDASTGVQVGTVKAWNRLQHKQIPTIIFLNKMDKEGVDFETVLGEIREKLGKNAIPFSYPLGKEANFAGFADCVNMKARLFDGKSVVDGEIHDDKVAKCQELHAQICEEVAKTDDALLEKFFAEEPFTPEEIQTGLRKGVLSGELVPVLCGSATKNIGSLILLKMFAEYLPSPFDLKPMVAKNEAGEEIEVATKLDAPLSAYVFKTIIDPYSGTVNLVKINSGVLHAGDDVYVNGATQKVSMLYSVLGKKLTNATEINAGDVCALGRMDGIESGMTICDPKTIVTFKPADYPTAVLYKAIELKNKAQESKMSTALSKLRLEDPCLEIKRNNETKQLLLGGLSSSHVDFAVNKLKDVYGVEVSTSPMKIVYRESIRGTAEALGSYKKQSGGSGFYGVVTMRFSPAKENEFAEEVFGGAVPKNFFPAVEKGFFEALQSGPLAGFPVIGVKGVLIDGKYHPVDSNEQAFRMAAILSFKEAYPKCKPIILEPIMKILVTVDSKYTGSVLSDLSTRRGRIQGMGEAEHGQQVVEALIPEAEIIDYASTLKSLTQASGSFTREFVDYEPVPEFLKDKVIAENKIENE